LANNVIELKKALIDADKEIQGIISKANNSGYLGIWGLSDDEKTKLNSDIDFVDQKKKDIEKSIKQIEDLLNKKTTTTDDNLADRFTKIIANAQPTNNWGDRTKAQWEEQYAEDKKWYEKKFELAYESRIAISDEHRKPFLELEKQYKLDLKNFGDNEGAKEELLKNYNLEKAKLQEKDLKKWNIKKLELEEENAISEDDKIAKSFLKLELAYKKDLEEFNKYFEYDDTSPSGLVWKVDRPNVNSKNSRLKGDCAGTLDKDKRWRVKLHKKKYYVHRIIWNLHFGTIPKKLVIHHIDEDSSNNKITNLHICTQKENTQFTYN